MANNVVLGDLSKYKGNDALKFDGVNDTVDCVNFLPLPTTSYSIVAKFKTGSIVNGTGYFGDAQYHTGGITLVIENDEFIVISNTVGSEYQSNCGIALPNTEYSVCIEYSGGDITITINDVIVASSSRPIYEQSENKLILGKGTQGGRTGYSEAVFDSLTYTVDGTLVLDWIQNGDFGDATLIDHSGNGNDGTIVGAQWWKQGVDEVFATPQLYKSSFDVPMEQSQRVVYTDATPYYNTNDVFWNPYNQDAIFDFKVRQQDVLIKWLLEQEHGEIDMVRQTIKGSTLGTGIVDLRQTSGINDTSRYPSYILATSDGILKVKYINDTDFTDLTVISDGTMYPIGLIEEIDVDASTVLIADIVLGLA